MEASISEQPILTGEIDTVADRTYEVVLSALEADAEGYYTFHFPALLHLPQFLALDRQPAQGVLDDESDFLGNFYSKAYEILGPVTGETIGVTLISDPERGGFRPFLAVLNKDGVTVAQTQGEPETSTSVTFTVESGQTYFAFATTLLKEKQGLFTLAATRNP